MAEAKRTERLLGECSAPQPITNIGQLFEALANGWSADSPNNPVLMATEWDGQFVRLPALFNKYPFYRKGDHDIPVESGGYRMRGFIEFEIPQMFPGLFRVSHAEDNVWWSAELTAVGFQFARAGLLAFDNSHPDIKRLPFFNPPTRAVEIDPRLGGPAAIVRAAAAIGGAA